MEARFGCCLKKEVKGSSTMSDEVKEQEPEAKVEYPDIEVMATFLLGLRH